LERWIFSKIEYPMVNSWKEGFINIFWADRHETPEGNRRNGKFQIWYAKPWVPLRCTRKPSKGKHWRCDMVVGRESSDIVCFLWKHGFLCRYSMYGTLFYDVSISLLKTV
jgi:hypothetical protein